MLRVCLTFELRRMQEPQIFFNLFLSSLPALALYACACVCVCACALLCVCACVTVCMYTGCSVCVWVCLCECVRVCVRAGSAEPIADLLGTLPVANGQCCKTNEDTFDDNC